MSENSATDVIPADRPASVLDELSWRGLVALTTDEQSLAAALAGGPITAYCGFDPTAPSLHFGNLVQLIVLRKLQRAGHRIICLVQSNDAQLTFEPVGAMPVMWPIVRGDTDSAIELTIRSRPHQACARASVSGLWRPKIFSPWP